MEVNGGYLCTLKDLFKVQDDLKTYEGVHSSLHSETSTQGCVVENIYGVIVPHDCPVDLQKITQELLRQDSLERSDQMKGMCYATIELKEWSSGKTYECQIYHVQRQYIRVIEKAQALKDDEWFDDPLSRALRGYFQG